MWAPLYQTASIYLDIRRGRVKQKLAVFLSHTSPHLVVLCCITHIVCSKLPLDGNTNATKQLLTTDYISVLNSIFIYESLCLKSLFHLCTTKSLIEKPISNDLLCWHSWRSDWEWYWITLNLHQCCFCEDQIGSVIKTYLSILTNYVILEKIYFLHSKKACLRNSTKFTTVTCYFLTVKILFSNSVRHN